MLDTVSHEHEYNHEFTSAIYNHSRAGWNPVAGGKPADWNAVASKSRLLRADWNSVSAGKFAAGIQSQANHFHLLVPVDWNPVAVGKLAFCR